MKMRAIVLIGAFFLVQISPGKAQAPTLKELLEVSKQNYPLLKSKLAEIEAVSHEVAVASSEYVPKISAQHQYTYGTDNSVAGSFYPNPAVISPSGGIRDHNISRAVWGSYTSALLEWNVVNFGKVSGNIKAAKANLENSKAAYANEFFQHQFKVADNYLLKLIADKLVSVQHVNLDRARRFKETIDAGVRSGLRPGVDSSLAHVEYVKAKLQLLEIERSQKSQTIRLFELTGNIESDLAAVDSMSFYTTLPNINAPTDLSPVVHPTLNFYQAQINASQQRSIAVKRSFLPSVTLVGAAWLRGSGVYNADDSYHTDFRSGTEYRVNNYLLGVATRWVISDYVSVRQRYKMEQDHVSRDEALYKDQDLRLSRQVRESKLQLDMALEQAHMAPTQLASAQHAFQQASARYNSGLTDLPTLLQSMTALNQAETDLAIAYSNAWRSLLAFAAAKGDITIFLNAAGIQ